MSFLRVHQGGAPDLSKVEAGHLEIERVACAPHAIARQAVKRAGQSARLTPSPGRHPAVARSHCRLRSREER